MKKMKKGTKILITVAVIVVVFLIVSSQSFFSVNQTKQAVLLRFGKILKVVKDPGLHIKIPFVDNVVYLEKRIINYDIQPEEIITADQKRLSVDDYALWKIENPKLFLESVKTVLEAQMRMDDIVYAYLRDVLAQYTLSDIISAKRTKYLKQVTLLTRKALMKFGIYTVDVRIKGADLPEANAQAVYQRMNSDRQKIAASYRAQGARQAAEIEAQANKKAKIILATAQKQADGLEGQGDSQALQIYADAYNQNPKFYKFWRTLQSYEISFATGTTVVLSTTSDYLKLLDKGTQ